MGKEVDVGIGKLETSDSNTVFVARALGSCVGVAMYDKNKKVGGMAHVLLPEGDKDKPEKPAMYADEAVRKLRKEIIDMGGNKRSLEAKIAGGSQMFSFKAEGVVGKKNVEAVEKALDKWNIKLAGKDTGGKHARTVKFSLGSMSMKIQIKV